MTMWHGVLSAVLCLIFWGGMFTALIRTGKRLLITGVVLPFVCIIVIAFGIVPSIYDAEIAADLGITLIGFFALWVLFLSVGAALWKLWRFVRTPKGG